MMIIVGKDSWAIVDDKGKLMANTTNPIAENQLIHILSWILDHLEGLCKSIVQEGEEIYPTVQQLVESGQLGKDIVKILATLNPVLVYAKSAFPQYAPLITWACNILQDIATFDAVNIPCTCPSCSSN